MTQQWKVQIFGEKGSRNWEISVIREDDLHGQRSYGWFGDTKILVSHNGEHCKWPIPEFVWEKHVETAYELCGAMNNGFDPWQGWCSHDPVNGLKIDLLNRKVKHIW